MYSVNDKIHYGSSGVCVIQEIATLRFGRTRERYYVLKPVNQNASMIYVPVENEQLVSKMRPVLSREEVHALIRTIPEVQTAWVEDVQERKSTFDEMLKRHSCADLIVLIKTLNEHKQTRQSRGKSLHVSDEGYLREAQRLLYDEFADALEIPPSQVSAYIQEQLELPA